MFEFRIVVNPETDDLIGEALYDALANKIGPRIVANANRTVPVLTGDLKRSITVQVDRDGPKTTLQVGYDRNAPGLLNPPMDYGVYVELGTSKMAPQLHLKNAVMQARGRIT